MGPELLTDLVTLSNELAALKGKPEAKPARIPKEADLPDDLSAILGSGALALKMQGVDVNRIDEFTERARGRGFRRRVRIFGWHPKGHTWFAIPENHHGKAPVLVIHRKEGLRVDETDVQGFVDLCAERTREAIAKARAAKVEAEEVKKEIAIEDRDPVTGHVRKKRPPVRVRLPEMPGMTVMADGKSETFEPEDHAYIVWCLEALTLLTKDKAPDMSRWERRCLRQVEMDAVPADGPDRKRYDDNWMRITVRDRTAMGSSSHRVAGYKLTAKGAWILHSNEHAILRRAAKSVPPRHKRSKEQKAIWKRWSALMSADQVELRVV